VKCYHELVKIRNWGKDILTKVETKNDIQKSKEIIDALYNLIISRTDYKDNAGLKDITDVLLQVNKTIDSNKYPERLISKMVSFIYSMGPAHKIFFPKDQEKLIDELGFIAQKAGNAGLYYASYNTKDDFFKGL